MKVIFFIFVFLQYCSAQNEPGKVGKLSNFFFGENIGNRLFYFPTKTKAKTPAHYGYEYDNVQFHAQDGTLLHGWFIKPTVSPAKGTVVFSHGNTGSIGTHFGFCSWLAKAGYQVFIYDYRGFGRSMGELDRAGIISDAAAAFEYIQTRKDILPNKIISFAHSLGGAKSIVALSQKKPLGLRAVIAHATFSSYKALAEYHAGAFAKDIVSDEFAPKDHIADLEGTPILLIHGTEDTTIPIRQAEELFAAAKEPKTFWSVAGGGHNKSLYQNKQEYRSKLLSWLDETLAAQ